MQIHTYLFFGGKCREAFTFYEQHLGGKIMMMMTWGDGPMKDNVPPDQHDHIMHGSLDLAGHVFMGTDSVQENDGIKGTNVVISVDEPEEAEAIFGILSEQGKVEMALEETFFAHRFGSLVDKFGVPWMVICGKEDQ